MLLSASVIPLRALQWQQHASAQAVPFKERYHLVAIGAFTHNALPGKLGDIIRSFLLSRTQRLPFLQCLGSVAVCKLLEFAALMLLVAVSFLGPFGKTMAHFAGRAEGGGVPVHRPGGAGGAAGPLARSRSPTPCTAATGCRACRACSCT